MCLKYVRKIMKEISNILHVNARDTVEKVGSSKRNAGPKQKMRFITFSLQR